MEELNDDILICENCNNAVNSDDDFCPECGTLFIDDIFCNNHNDILAEGVCIICSLPFCEECSEVVNNHFLCSHHSNYEIYEGTVRVYETYDDVAVQNVKTCLEQDGLHPILFNRLRSPYGTERYHFGNKTKGLKVMVPIYEVLKAEEILKSLKLLDE